MKVPSRKKLFSRPLRGFATRAIHAGQAPDPGSGAVMVPITLSSTFAQEAPGQHKGYEYSRASNPTRRALEECLSSLEGGRYGFATSSGVSACLLVFELLSPGDILVAEKDLYGGTLRLLFQILKPRGVEIHLRDFSDPQALKFVPQGTKMIWLESPTNPELKILDIHRISRFAKRKNILLAVDNTFLSPFFQKPLKLGADVVVHSATKYLGGHSDILGGVVITSKEELAQKFQFFSLSSGPVLSPFDSYLLLRSLKTLPVRMKAHQENASFLASVLQQQGAIERVIYPGLRSHPQHLLACRQMSGFGGMISFILKGGKKSALKCLRRFQIVTLAESLGGVESLVEHPASMTHASSPHPPPPGLVRLSVGLEDKEDLKKDLLDALRGI